MNSPQPVAPQTPQHVAASVGIHLPASAQHVLDALEAHLGAIVAHAKTASPGATAVIAECGDAVLDRLEAWGVELRGTLESYRSKLHALIAQPQSISGGGWGNLQQQQNAQQSSTAPSGSQQSSS